jgi:DNA-binding beta-propeller fold protein YncE
VHGLGFSPDHRTIAVVAIGSNAVNFIDTAANTVKHVTYVGRSPHEAFFTPDGKENLAEKLASPRRSQPVAKSSSKV